MLVEQWNVAIVSFNPVYWIYWVQRNLHLKGLHGFFLVCWHQITCNHIMSWWSNYNQLFKRSVVFHWGDQKRKGKEGLSLSSQILIGWCALTVHSFKVLYTHVSWVESSYDWRSTVGLTQPAKDNLALLSRRRQTQNNVQSLFFNRVWQRCATGTWENLFARILFAELIDYFNVMVVCE